MVTPAQKKTKNELLMFEVDGISFFLTTLETCSFETHPAPTSKRKQQPQKAGATFSPSPSPFAVTSQKIPNTKQTTLHFHLYYWNSKATQFSMDGNGSLNNHFPCVKI